MMFLLARDVRGDLGHARLADRESAVAPWPMELPKLRPLGLELFGRAAFDFHFLGCRA